MKEKPIKEGLTDVDQDELELIAGGASPTGGGVQAFSTQTNIAEPGYPPPPPK